MHSAHIQYLKIYDDDIGGEYIDEARKYFVTVIGHYRNYVVKNLDKIDKMDIKPKWIAPSYGVIWKNPSRILSYYRKWSVGERESGKIVVIYNFLCMDLQIKSYLFYIID